MYSLICDGQLIAKTSSDDIAFESGSLLERVSAAPVLSCVLMPENPYKNLISLRSSVLTLERAWKDERGQDVTTEIFRGQVVATTLNEDGFFEISALGDMSYLSEVLIAPFSWSGTLSGLLGQILSRYNAKASAWKKIYKGTVGLSGTGDFESTAYRTAWDLISGLCKEYGGMLEMRWLNNGTRGLDWLEDSGRYSRQTALWGDNLLSLEISQDASEVVNTLIAQGEKVDDVELVETVTDDASVALYGVICGTEKFDGAETSAALIARAQAALGKMSRAARSVGGRAIDRWEDGNTPFRTGDFVRTISRQHLLDEWLVCSELRHDLTMGKPEQVTLGRIGDSLTASGRTGLINKWIAGTQGTQPARVRARDRNGAYATDTSGAYAVSERTEG